MAIRKLAYDEGNELEWLEMRKRHVTSTDAAALYNASPYKSELELWYEHTTGEHAVINETRRMRAGKRIEPAIGRMVDEDLETHCVPFKQYLWDDELRAGSSFDWRVWDSQSKYQGWLVEIKNVDSLIFRRTWSAEDEDTGEKFDLAPAHIEIQCQWQMLLYPTAPGVILAVLVGGNDLRLVLIERDDEMIAKLRERVIEFWASVDSKTMPEVDYARDAEFIIALHQSSEENVLNLAEGGDTAAALLELVIEYKNITAKGTEIDARKKAIKAEALDMHIGDEVQKVALPDGFSISCKMGRDVPMEFVRKGSRGFRVNKSNAVRGKKKAAKKAGGYEPYEANR
jgi:predicted phage-related endonuclease